MISRFLASATCLLLAPLLVAQQAAPQTSTAQIHINLTGHGGFRFLAPQPEALASVHAGDQVQFTVETDVTSGDAVLFHAGVPVAGVVAQVKHGSRIHHRDGEISIQVTEMVAGKLTEVVVRCSNPEEQYAASSSPHDSTRVWHEIAGIAVVGVVLLVIIAAAKHPDG